MRTPKSKEPSQKPKRILIVDDHTIVREAVMERIKREPGWEVCGQARTAAEALSAVEKTGPDLIVADITLPGRSGLELIRDVHAISPQLPVLVLSMHEEAVFAERVLRAGGRGYVCKEAGADTLIEAIQRVLRGQIYVSENISTRLLDGLSATKPRGSAASPVEKLSDRELEVFALIGQAYETKEIARRLHMSSKTVEAHRGAIKRKLKLKSGPELTRHAVLWVEATK